jgi:hypothetical protein
MKECDNSKIPISSNFILSISLLIMFDTLLLRPSLHCNTPLHFTTIHPTTLHYTSLHFTTVHPTTLHHTSPQFTQLHFTTLHHISPNYTSLHFTTIHPTTLYYTSSHFTQQHFSTLIDTSLPPIYTSLPCHLALRIYISYLSISLHITSQYRSHPQTYFQNNKPLHCPKELLTISLHFTSLFILFYFIYLFTYPINPTLHFT